MVEFLKEPGLLSRGVYLEMVVSLKFLDDAIIRSNEPEEVLTFSYKAIGSRFVIPWRKVKGKLRRMVMEKQRGLEIEPACHLKDDLCMRCPSCFLFGGTGETSSADVPYNILARVMGETFISKEEMAEIQPYTANAIDEETLSTGRGETGALFTLIKVPAETEFLGVITLRDPTPEMVSIVVDNIERLSRLGARSVEWGRVKTQIAGFRLSDREALSAYGLLADGKDQNLESISSLSLPDVDQSYKRLDRQVKKLIESLG
jgi:CRISPR type I-D-associated protein Csc2